MHLNAFLHWTHLLFEVATESWVVSPVKVVEWVCCCFIDFIAQTASVVLLPNDVNRLSPLLCSGRLELLEICRTAYSLVENGRTRGAEV